MEFQIWGYLVFVLGLAALALAFRTMRRKRLVDDIPTSRTHGVFIGLVELKGTAESEKPFTGFLSAEQCVYYYYKVEERWSRMVTESFTDAKGHVQFRTRQESGWTQVASGKEMQPFYLKDETGIILIQPEGADIQPKNLFNRTCGQNDAVLCQRPGKEYTKLRPSAPFYRRSYPPACRALHNGSIQRTAGYSCPGDSQG
ncbi:LemA family protein, partial [Dehalococcoides mccartyi]